MHQNWKGGGSQEAFVSRRAAPKNRRPTFYCAAGLRKTLSGTRLHTIKDLRDGKLQIFFLADRNIAP